MNRNKIPVITGMGIISCLGNDLDQVTRALKNTQSGIVIDQKRKELGFRSALTGQINNFDPAVYGLGRRLMNTMAEPAIYAYAALIQALHQSQLDQSSISELDAGIIVGNDTCSQANISMWDTLQQEKQTRGIGAGSIFKVLNSTITMNLATIFKIKGANWTISAACASGAHAIGQAALLIESGQQDVMICGGAQEITGPAMAAFDAINAFSTREQEPEKASRPFDQDRDGLVPSGGSAIIILESEEHAKSRGAEILGKIAGYGFSSDGYHLSLPAWQGSLKAMQKALKMADISANDIDYINAHATSTPKGDAAEARAVAHLFPRHPLVSSTKGLTGHECWMAGASEVVYSTLMAQSGFIAANANFEQGDEVTSQLNIPDVNVKMDPHHILSNSFGFGGTNASLILSF